MTLANPYLLGNYAPVASEETVTDLSVTGALPSTLNGRYLRNGPNPITPPDPWAPRSIVNCSTQYVPALTTAHAPR